MFRNKAFLLFLLCILIHFSCARLRSLDARNSPSNVQIHHPYHPTTRFDKRLSRRMQPAEGHQSLASYSPSNLPESPRISTVLTDSSLGAVTEAGPSQAGPARSRSSRQRAGTGLSPHTEIEFGHVPDQPVAAAHTAGSNQAGNAPLVAPTPQQIAQAQNICETHRNNSH
jgi:hypothetical protein